MNETYNAFSGNLTRPNFEYIVTAKRGGLTTGTGEGKTDAWHAAPWTYLRNGDGQQIDVRPGDIVGVQWGAEQESMAVFGLTAQVDPKTEQVTGTWLPNRFVRVRDQNTYTPLFVPTDASGAFVADFTGLVDLRAHMQVDVSAWDDEWNRTEIIVPVPYARANATWDNVDGNFAPGAVVSYVVKGSDGATKSTRSGQAGQDGWFSLNCGCDMVFGDTVHVTSDRGCDATLTLIPITAQPDPDTDGE